MGNKKLRDKEICHTTHSEPLTHPLTQALFNTSLHSPREDSIWRVHALCHTKVTYLYQQVAHSTLFPIGNLGDEYIVGVQVVMNDFEAQQRLHASHHPIEQLGKDCKVHSGPVSLHKAGQALMARG